MELPLRDSKVTMALCQLHSSARTWDAGKCQRPVLSSSCQCWSTGEAEVYSGFLGWGESWTLAVRSVKLSQTRIPNPQCIPRMETMYKGFYCQVSKTKWIYSVRKYMGWLKQTIEAGYGRQGWRQRKHEHMIRIKSGIWKHIYIVCF